MLKNLQHIQCLYLEKIKFSSQISKINKLFIKKISLDRNWISLFYKMTYQEKYIHQNQKETLQYLPVILIIVLM